MNADRNPYRIKSHETGLCIIVTGNVQGTALDGPNPLVFESAQDGAISPNGVILVYSNYSARISIADLTTSQTVQIPGTANGDFNPIWSTDSKQIVFMHGMGSFDIFLEANGTNMRHIANGGVQEWLCVFGKQILLSQQRGPFSHRNIFISKYQTILFYLIY